MNLVCMNTVKTNKYAHIISSIRYYFIEISLVNMNSGYGEIEI